MRRTERAQRVCPRFPRHLRQETQQKGNKKPPSVSIGITEDLFFLIF